MISLSHNSFFHNNIIIPFINQLDTNPEKIAFCIEEEFYTYKQLKDEINKIRQEIKNNNPEKNPIGLMTNDDLTTYASIWAIWIEGYSYVPIHPKQPKERNLEIIDLAKCSLLLNSKDESISLSISTLFTSLIDNCSNELSINEVSDLEIAYILFTSGSTGEPKGVPISRANVSSFVDSFLSVGFKLSSDDRFLQSFDLTFDVSVQCFIIPLIFGASIYTIPHHCIKYSYVYGLLEDHKITFATMAPSMVRYLQPYFDELNLTELKYSILTAEASVTALVDDWSKCIPNAKIYNFYGPTEATIYCTYYQYQSNHPNPEINGILTIGQPMKGIISLLIDDNNQPVSGSQKGELCISGGQVTEGYLSNSEKNKSSFIELLIDGINKRFYKTGDICFMEQGHLMYIGRADHQVKIQGYRVELSEIEFHVRQAIQGKNAVAVPYQHISQTTEIALFIEDQTSDEVGIKQYLKQKLPTYMIPSKFIFQKEFPLNSNGKIDRKSLSLELNSLK